jgi:predicted ribosomally synthesized peptide with nif11-like leader
MSRQAVMNFIIKANEDKALYEKVNTLPSSRVELLIDIARDAGFDFTADEFVSTVLEHSRNAGQLEEDDLEQVAGGASDYLMQGIDGATYKFYMPTDQFSLNFVKFTGK